MVQYIDTRFSVSSHVEKMDGMALGPEASLPELKYCCGI